MAFFNDSRSSQQIRAISSALSTNQFSRKQFSIMLLLFFMQSSPTTKTDRQTLPASSESMQMIVQQIYAFYALFDRYAMRNRCFQTYILFIILQSNYYIQSFSLIIIYYQLTLYPIAQHSILYRYMATAPILTNINYDQNSGLIARNSAFITQSLKKSAKEQYEDIFKTLSANYFDNTAFGALVSKKQGKRSTNTNYNNDKPSASADKDSSQKKGFSQIQQYFDSNKQLARFLKIGDVFKHEFRPKQQHQLTKSCLKQNFMPQSGRSNFKQKNLKQNSNIHVGLKSYRQYKSRAETANKKLQKRIRPFTSSGCCKNYRPKSVNLGKAVRNDIKFIKLDKNQHSNQILQLKKSVNNLQNIAVNKYGVEFQKFNCNLQVEKDSEYLIEDLDKKLYQIKHKRHESQPKQSHDYSIPNSFLKMVSPNKKFVASSNWRKKSTASTYLRF